MSKPAPLRRGLLPHIIMDRSQREALARAEAAVVLLARGLPVRRIGDPPGTTRLADMTSMNTSPMIGLVVDVRGYVNGVEDPGLQCRACPLSDLVLAEWPEDVLKGVT